MAGKISSMGFLGSGQMARALVKGFVGASMLKIFNTISYYIAQYNH